LADRQLHQTALSPSSIELSKVFNLGNISFRPFFNQGWSLQHPASSPATAYVFRQKHERQRPWNIAASSIPNSRNKSQ
jgi:hypothetical protein